jgi:hypothetical protein
MKTKLLVLLIIIVIPVVLFLFYLGSNKGLSHKSPSQIISLYFKSEMKGDTETLRKIIYFPSGTSEEEKTAKVTAASNSGGKGASPLGFATIKPVYEKIIDNNTAEVGLVIVKGIGGIGKRIPYAEIIMRKDEGIWKCSDTKDVFTEEELIAKIRKNPQEAWPYYYLGEKYRAENPVRANKYYKKYYELEPKGFWVDNAFLENIKEIENIKEEEQRALLELSRIPENSSSRAGVYKYLCQLFTESGDYKKAQMYMEKAEVALKVSSQRNTIIEERVRKTKERLLQQMNGQSSDILTEVEGNASRK